MIVKTLTAWAGRDFSFAHGEAIDLPSEIATARIAEGLAEPWRPDPEAPLTRPVSRWPGPWPEPTAESAPEPPDGH
jgi:hypothetical protein